MVFRKESLLKRIEKLKEYRHDIKEMELISFDDYIKDKKIRYSIERLLFLISENILDYLDHILSTKYEIVSESYEDIIDHAYENNLLSKDLYLKLKGLGGFRNILAHEYLELSNEEVYRNFKKFAGLIDTIIVELERHI